MQIIAASNIETRTGGTTSLTSSLGGLSSIHSPAAKGAPRASCNLSTNAIHRVSIPFESKRACVLQCVIVHLFRGTTNLSRPLSWAVASNSQKQKVHLLITRSTRLLHLSLRGNTHLTRTSHTTPPSPRSHHHYSAAFACTPLPLERVTAIVLASSLLPACLLPLRLRINQSHPLTTKNNHILKNAAVKGRGRGGGE